MNDETVNEVERGITITGDRLEVTLDDSIERPIKSSGVYEYFKGSTAIHQTENLDATFDLNTETGKWTQPVTVKSTLRKGKRNNKQQRHSRRVNRK